MLGFKTVSILFITAFVVILFVDTQVNISIWLYPLLVALFLVFLAIGSAKIDSGFFLPVVCHGSGNEKSIAITFDDGPRTKYTPEILEVLKLNNTPATFFCIGKNIREHPELIKRIDREGHLIGNHSYSHSFFFDFYSYKKIEEELSMVNDLVRTVIQKELRYFRPPYGVTTPNIAKAVKAGKFKAIGWSVRSLDTMNSDKDVLLNKTLSKVNAGDIILFHDTEENTLNMLQEFIDKVKQRGFRIVRLDQLLNIPAYA